MARILGKKMNFPDSDALEIDGPRSEGADKAVAAAVEDAKKFVAANRKVNHLSSYTGVSNDKRSKTNPWRAEIHVSPKM